MRAGSPINWFEKWTPWYLGGLFLCFVAWTGFAWSSPGPGSAKRPPESAVKGKIVWLERNCQTCHQLYGLGGYLGPDLTNVHSRRGESYIRTILENGRGNMPVLGLSPEEIAALVGFLEYVDRTGVFPPKRDPATGFNN